jgi:hypothetical protein
VLKGPITALATKIYFERSKNKVGLTKLDENRVARCFFIPKIPH